MTPEELYFALGHVIEEQPNPEEMHEFLKWLGRAQALVHEVSPVDAAAISAATSVRLHGDPWYVRDIANAALYRALAVAELRAPVSAQGAFIPAGNSLDALASVSKVLQLPVRDLMIVDPYMDEKMLIDFCPLASEGIQIKLLTDDGTAKPSFVPSYMRFKHQFGSKRPIEARMAAPKTLHDRLIVIDDTTVFSVTQSFNALAARSPASIIRADPETAGLKVAAYAALWASATTV